MAEATSTGDRPPIHLACLDNDGARALVSRLYGWSVDCIKRLPGYDDRNFYLKSTDSSFKHSEFVLKVVNSRESGSPGLMEVHMEVLLYLVERGIHCPIPVKNLKGDYCSLEEIVDKTGKQPTGLKFMVLMMVFIPGKLVRDLYKPDVPIPDKWFYVMGQSLGTMNKALLDFQKPSVAVLQKQADEYVWSPNYIPRVRHILWVVKDEGKRKLAENVLAEFEAQVVPELAGLRRSILHTDFNDMNIISLKGDPTPCDSDWHTAGGLDISANQDSVLQTLGVIDFMDVVYSSLVFDPSNSQAYMMMSQSHGDPLVSGGHFLAGYNSVLPLTATEMGLVQCCSAARLVQSLVNGLHAYTLDPSSEYILDTQKTGWTVLEQLWSKPRNELISMWERIADLYCPSVQQDPLLTNIKEGDVETTLNSNCITNKPFLSARDAQRLLQNLFSVEEHHIQEIEEFIGYDDQNFYVRLTEGELVERAESREFVLKVINSRDSVDRGAFDMQVSVLKFLKTKGFCCAEPVVNVKGEYLSLEKMHRSDGGWTECGDNQRRYGLFLVFLLTYIPGHVMRKIRQVPEQLCFDVGVTLARMDRLLWDFPDIPDSFKSRAADYIWAMESFPEIRIHMAEVQDEKRQRLVESIIKTFEEEVVPKIRTLRKCLIHSDYNDDNILVAEISSGLESSGDSTSKLDPSPARNTKHHPKYHITGVIDFTDLAYSCLVFEIANAMAMMMYANVADPTAATAHLLAGFQSVIPLNAEELDLLYVCLVAHLVHELVLSLYSHRLQPDNAHVTITQGRGWTYVEEMWHAPGARDRTEKLWKDINDSYTV